MHPKTRENLNAFIQNVNWQIPQHLDDDRFDRFIIRAYKEGDKYDGQISYEEFCEILNYPDVEIMNKFYIKYENGLNLLSVLEKGEY